MMPHFRWTAAAAAILFSAAACDSALSPRPRTPAPATSGLDTSPWQLPALPKPAQVVVVLSTAQLSVGQSAQASAKALTEDGNAAAGGSVTWASDDSSVAAVDNGGLIRGVAAGATRIVATMNGVIGSALINVVAPAVTPSFAVASVSVSLTQTVLSSGETAEATATARDALGRVMTGQPVAWQSSNPRVAAVSGSGVVTAVLSGTATITAIVGGVSGDATLFVATVDPGFANNSPAPGHPNEPAGFVRLSPTLSGDTVPLTGSGPLAAYELGWVQRDMSEITQVIDTAVPFASKKVLNINFPSGMIGGGSPGLAYTYQWGVNPQNWPQQPTQLYLSFWYKLSPNYPLNLSANKITYTNIGGLNKAVIEANGSADYPIGPDGNAVFVRNGATQYTAAIFPSFCAQNIVSIDGTPNSGQCLNPNTMGGDPANWPQIKRGRWYHWEVLYVANTAGKGDGGGAIWIDGQLVSDWRGRIKWSETADHFQWTSWWPVYGGGGSIPNDGVGGYHRLKDFYVSGR